MHDPSEAAAGPPPGPPRRTGPRHAAPEDPPASATAWQPPDAPAGGRAARRRRGRGAGSRTPRGLWLALGATVAAIAVVLVVGLVRDDDDGGSSPAAAASSAGTAPAGPDVPVALTDWLRTELPPGGTVAAEPELRSALEQAGVDPAVLTESQESQPGADPSTPALILTTTPPEGGRVLARFERTGSGEPLLLVDPAPVEPTDEQRERRESLAAAVLANPTTRAEGDARAVLGSGDVDARLLSLIAALTAQEGVGLWSFERLPGEEPGAAPARRVVVDAVGGQPVPADGATTQRLVAWLDAQLPPFAPDLVEVTGDGVVIAFDYVPGPDAVVAAATP